MKPFPFNLLVCSLVLIASIRDGSSFSEVKLPDLHTQLEYVRNGHTVMRDLVDDSLLRSLRKKLWKHGKRQELDAWRQKVEVATDSPKLAAACKTVEECQSQLESLGIPAESVPFLQYFHAWQTIPDVKQLAISLAQVAAMLMDVSSVRLYQDSLFWKRPGDGPTPWHVDARMAPFDTSHMITLWIPLQPVPAEGTALVFCSKSHSDFALPYWNPYNTVAIEEDPASPWNQLEERYNDPGFWSKYRNVGDNMDIDPLAVDYMPMNVGDVTAHSGWTLHCANPNFNDDDDDDNRRGHRLALAISYVDARAPIRKSFASSKKDRKGDSEDAWSYQGWISEAPKDTYEWDHPSVPIVWPPEQRTRSRKD